MIRASALFVGDADRDPRSFAKHESPGGDRRWLVRSWFADLPIAVFLPFRFDGLLRAGSDPSAEKTKHYNLHEVRDPEALSHVPIRWKRPIERDSLRIDMLEHVLIEEIRVAFSGHAPGTASGITPSHHHELSRRYIRGRLRQAGATRRRAQDLESRRQCNQAKLSRLSAAIFPLFWSATSV